MIVGTAGHIDHGKTSLVRALTGTDTGRLAEEKRRGITIDLGFAYLPTGERVIGFVDVPGHERLVHTMLAGAAGIDLVLLVVAADDGVMPQTREHLAIAHLLGLARGVSVVTKCDLVGPERVAAVRAEVAGLLAGTSLAGIDTLSVSTATGAGVDALRQRLTAEADAATVRTTDGRFRLAVDRSFTLAGTGTVVTGTVLSGEVRAGDRVVVGPGGLPARVRSLRAQARPVEIGRAGERCALNLAGDGVTKDAIRRGDVVLAPSLHAPTDRLDAVLTVLASEPEAIRPWFPVRLHHGAAEIGARVVPLAAATLAPGAEGPVQLVLERPIAASEGDRFVLRDTSAQRTVGGGRFLDLRAPARRRRTPDRLAALEARRADEPARLVAELLARPPLTLDLQALARDRAWDGGAPERLADGLGLVQLANGSSPLALSAATWAALARTVVEAVGAFHADNPDLQGIGLERLRVRVEPRLPGPAFRSALARLASAGEVAVAGSFIRLPGHEVHLTPAEEEIWKQVGPRLAGAERFRPPRVRDIAGLLGVPEAEMRQALKRLGRAGEVDEVAHDHFFLRTTVGEMAGIVRNLSDGNPAGWFTAAQFRDQVQNGRKVAIQILDFFDRHGVTMRRGDERRANPHRLDLFAPDTLGRHDAADAA